MLLGTRNTVKTIGTLGSISVAVLLLAACGQQQSKPSSHINVAISAELQTLDPDHVVETTGDEVLKPTRIKDMQSGTFDIIVAGWSPDYADPASFLDIFTSSNPYNIGGYSNAAFDKQMQIADTTADTNTRWNAMVKAEQIIMQDQGVLPLYQLSTAYLRNPKIKGVVHNAAAADPGWRGVSINK